MPEEREGHRTLFRKDLTQNGDEFWKSPDRCLVETVATPRQLYATNLNRRF
jgi:hypothetical protein